MLPQKIGGDAMPKNQNWLKFDFLEGLHELPERPTMLVRVCRFVNFWLRLNVHSA
jgi:hypothetical protein